LVKDALIHTLMAQVAALSARVAELVNGRLIYVSEP